MISAPEYSNDVEAIPTESPEAPATESVPNTPAPPVKFVWPVSDLALIGLVAGLTLAAAVTAVQRARQERTRDRVAAEFKAAAAGFETYMREHGQAPATANTGTLPRGMAPFLTGLDWAAPTAGGGSFRWTKDPAGEPGGETRTAGVIAITAYPPGPPLALTAADLREIDRRIDDGDLTTGKFRVGFNGWPFLRVEAPR